MARRSVIDCGSDYKRLEEKESNRSIEADSNSIAGGSQRVGLIADPLAVLLIHALHGPAWGTKKAILEYVFICDILE